MQRVQFQTGNATFEDMAILDVHPAVRLNLTVFLSRFPWSRRPDSYTDFASKVIFAYDGGDTVLFMNTSYAQDPAVYLSPPIEVTRKLLCLSLMAE